MDEETVIDKLIKHWEKKLGVEIDKGDLKLIKAVAYQYLDELIEQKVTLLKEEKERSQRLKGLGLE